MNYKATPRVIVIATRLASSNSVVFSAWEPSSFDGEHFEVTHHRDLGWIGRIGARRLPPELDQLPWSDERSSKIRAFYAAENDRAYKAIIEVLDRSELGPRLREGKQETGQIVIGA